MISILYYKLIPAITIVIVNNVRFASHCRRPPESKTKKAAG